MSKLRALTLVSLLTVLVAVGCSSSDQGEIDKTVSATPEANQAATAAPTATPEPTATPTATVIPTATDQVIETETRTDQEDFEASSKGDELQQPSNSQSAHKKNGFWNEPLQGWGGTPACASEMKFTHPLISDTDGWGLMTGPNKASPHNHMVYWGVPNLEEDPTFEGQVNQTRQIYAPTDFYYVDIRQQFKGAEPNSYEEWGAYFYTCDGYGVSFGHVGEPSVELKNILGMKEGDCPIDLDKDPCGLNFTRSENGAEIWEYDEDFSQSNGEIVVPAGTPLFKTSGYANFDFGIDLYGLDENELRDLPTYGYSINPWRSGAGKTICPLLLFEEPMKSEYLSLLGDFSCGPMNQDVPGTAMGLWYPSPSPETIPNVARWRDENEWDPIWMYEDFRFSHSGLHAVTSGHFQFGLENVEQGYRYEVADDGFVNRRWDEVVAGNVYCMELGPSSNVFEHDNLTKTMLVSVSQDGLHLTLEAVDGSVCGDGPWSFSGNQSTYYR